MTKEFEIASHAVTINGRFPKIAKLRDEYYDHIGEPAAFVRTLKMRSQGSGDLFSFLQRVSDLTPRHPFHMELESAAVLELTTYDYWWRKQINDKTRNRIRKAEKSGVEIREQPFSDELVEGIVKIYNESPFRQGCWFRHYGKPFEQVREEHSTFLDRSEFFGAYLQGELIGFIKLVHGEGTMNIMHIIAMTSHWDKSPTNALLAKAVERCAMCGVRLLHYGTWSRRSMGDFKKRHAFTRVEVPRYYVPLSITGALALRLGLHRSLRDRVPEPWLDQMAALRSRWNSYRYAALMSRVEVARPVSAQVP